MIIVSQDRDEIFNMDQAERIECGQFLPGIYGIFITHGGKRDIAGKYTKHESAEKVLEEIITTYKDRIPDENTVFYMAKEEE